MDVVDQASGYTDQMLSAALSTRKPELPAKGRCYNCDDPLKTGCFCDADCRDDYEKRVRARNFLYRGEP